MDNINDSQIFICICGRQFNKKTSLISHHGHCQMYQDATKAEKQKYYEEHHPTILSNGKYKCQNPECGKEHDGTYGSGRFCSKHCRLSYAALKSKESPKHKAHMKKLNDLRKVPYGTWKCEECNLIFETRYLLYEHNIQYHNKISTHCLNGLEKKYKCPYCGKEYDQIAQIRGHLTSCPNHPNKKQHDEAHKQSGQTYKQKRDNGEYNIQHLGFIKGSHHSIETKQKISQKRAEQVKNEYLTNFHAKVKWYKIKNIKDEEFSVRGHWEENVAKRLNELNIYWVKAQPIKYFKEYWHNYTADFYIPNLDVYIEVKGRYPDTDREKMKLVVEQHPDKKIYFIHNCYHDFIAGKIEFNDKLIISKKDL